MLFSLIGSRINKLVKANAVIMHLIKYKMHSDASCLSSMSFPFPGNTSWNSLIFQSEYLRQFLIFCFEYPFVYIYTYIYFIFWSIAINFLHLFVYFFSKIFSLAYWEPFQICLLDIQLSVWELVFGRLNASLVSESTHDPYCLISRISHTSKEPHSLSWKMVLENNI